MLLLLTAPLRAAWADAGRQSSWSDLGSAIASTTLMTGLIAFFFTCAFGVGTNWPQGLTFDPITERNEEAVELGLATAYVATMILVVAALALLRRWELPTGALTLLWTAPVLLENLAFGGDSVAIPSAIAGGAGLALLAFTPPVPAEADAPADAVVS